MFLRVWSGFGVKKLVCTVLTYQKIEYFDVMRQLLRYKRCNVVLILGYNKHVRLADDTHKYTCNRIKMITLEKREEKIRRTER